MGNSKTALAVTTSGSGLDPHISIENAGLQAVRVAAARNMSEQEINRLIEPIRKGDFYGSLEMSG